MTRFLCFIVACLMLCAPALSETAPIPSASACPTAAPSPTASPAPTETPALSPEPSPTPGPLTGLLIGIDPGHQLHENSALECISPTSSKKKPKVSSGTSGVSSHVAEHVVNLSVALKLRDALTAQGATVLMTRETEDVDISNIERAVMMNEAGADLVLRLHCDGSDSHKPSGTALYVRRHGAKAEESYEAAQLLIAAMCAETGAKNRGIVRNDSYTGLNWSEVPAILVEMGFMSNPSEDLLLNDPAYQDRLVAGMVKGIAQAFGRSAAPELADPTAGE